MFMKTKLLFASVVGIAAGMLGGCSSVDHDTMVLGQTEQPISVKIRPHYTYGVNRIPSANAGACTEIGGAFEDCLIPTRLTINFCFSATHQDTKDAWIGATNKINAAQNQHFQFVSLGNCTVPTPQASAHVIVREAVCGVGQGNMVENYGCIDWTWSTALLTGGAGNTRYYMMASPRIGTVKFDREDLVTYPGSSVLRAQLKENVAGNLALQFIGLGTRSDVSGVYSRRSIIPVGTRAALTTGERCAAESFDPTTPPFTFGTVDSCGED